jgi:hypothetical protein
LRSSKRGAFEFAVYEIWLGQVVLLHSKISLEQTNVMNSATNDYLYPGTPHAVVDAGDVADLEPRATSAERMHIALAVLVTQLGTNATGSGPSEFSLAQGRSSASKCHVSEVEKCTQDARCSKTATAGIYHQKAATSEVDLCRVWVLVTTGRFGLMHACHEVLI